MCVGLDPFSGHEYQLKGTGEILAYCRQSYLCGRLTTAVGLGAETRVGFVPAGFPRHVLLVNTCQKKYFLLRNYIRNSFREGPEVVPVNITSL